MRGHLVAACDASSRDRVPLGLQSTADVDGRRTVAPPSTRPDEVDRTARFAESEVVVMDEFGRREAVVELDEVEVVGPIPACS